MGLTNWVGQRLMKREARRIAKWAAERYPIVKSENANSPEPHVLAKMLFEDISQTPERVQKKIYERCQSIEGVCYTAALDLGPLGANGLMTFRCLQFTRYMDDELHARGFKRQSKETEERVLTALDLNVEGWEKITCESY